eukprot:TRINITY_DN5359_c0_g1_i3.p2 TRINITY_DN5359_c0_g1~~TRINITY_DN5359_c0_g1_i3.p2  ORF type:complete len:150 (+),score=28.36 TRINITY_DN5359_c0_g1_i3:111-560(+)
MDQNNDKDPIDIKKVIEITETEQNAKEMMSMFLENTLVPYVRELSTSMLEKKYEDVKSRCHALRGSSGYLAAEDFRRSATNLRDHARGILENPVEFPEEKICDLYKAFMHEASRLKEYLLKQLEKSDTFPNFDVYVKEYEKSWSVKPVQ